MARILLAWELGANLGHVAPLRALARDLVGRGHHCTFAARDLNAAEEFIEPELGPVLQAPVRLNAGKNPVRAQVSYASLLNNSGFDDIIGLAGRIRAWRQLIQSVQPQLLVADHSPTALLAAKTLNLPALHFGTGFTVPPLTRPFPVFRPGAVIPHHILEHNEMAVLANINAALARMRLPPLATLQDILSGSLHYVASYPDLDHYEVPRNEPYIGVPDCAHGMAPPWPQGTGPKILVYLRPFKDLQVVLSALGRSQARVLLRVGDISAAKLKQFLRPGMVIVDQSVHMGQAAESCDAFVNYASHGVTAELLLAGKPGLLLPNNLERSLVARRAQQLGAVLVPPEKGEFNLSEALRRIIEDGALRKSAQRFAGRYRQQNRAQILPLMAADALGRLKIQ